MRASKSVKGKSEYSTLKIQNSKLREIHISGAEGLYNSSEIQRIVKKYIEKALAHPKGKPDKIIITLEDIKEKPKEISSLPVRTIYSRSTAKGEKIAIKLLKALDISEKAIHTALEIIRKKGMRGAAIISGETGKRLEPDKQRGIRVSRLGIDTSASRLLSSRLSQHGINTDTVKEALILASKVISSQEIIAELCVSDDPDYTTGYIASEKFGYVRIPNIKGKGRRTGGRAFFVKEGSSVRKCINYLEKKPVMINKISLCRGTSSIDEIVDSPYM